MHCHLEDLLIECAETDMADVVQVLQLALAAVFVLVAASMFAGWLPSGCFGALLLTFPVVSAPCIEQQTKAAA